MTAATTWPWERLNRSNASSHETLATLLDPQPAERWLDVGTGGGGLAFLLARSGADVVGVDVAEDGLAHARAAAAELGLSVGFVLGDAQELPFDDAEFDGVASAFGVIFAADHERAAAELARVCRPGGKLGLTLMPADSQAAGMWTLIRRFGGANGAHPAEWAERASELLGEWFELEIERRASPDSPPAAVGWDDRVRAFAPLRELVERLAPEDVAALRRELGALDVSFRGRPPSYFLVLGTRR